ncbi:MAG: DNA-3-methyladenine glycosylase [Rhizomicrobium sp.]
MPARKPLPKNFFARDADTVARALIGTTLTFGGVGGVIVETESYDSSDPASHAFGRRQTRRNAVMFGPPGHAYVYRIYGMHWCLNFVCVEASAVLIRALEPRFGIAKMQARRGTDVPGLLCSGPGRLCQALGISDAQNGMALGAPPFALYRAADMAELSVGPRIGLTKAVEAQRRFGLARSRFLSRRFPDA